MGFSPPLGTTLFLAASPPSGTGPARSPPSSAGSAQREIHFCYVLTVAERTGFRPEVWTNLPRRDEKPAPGAAGGAPDSDWHAIPLAPQGSVLDHPALYTASVPLPTEAGEFEFTYRFCHSPSGEVEWRGGPDGNGKIVVVDAASSDAVEARCKWEGPDLQAVKADGADWGEVSTVEGGKAVVGRFCLGNNDKVRAFEIDKLVPTEMRGSADGLVWERSTLYWVSPRQLGYHEPLKSLSPVHPGELLVLRARPTREHLRHRYLVLFPFSTPQVCSYLLGGPAGDSSALRLHCEPDAVAPSEPAYGHLAVAWGNEGRGSAATLADLVQLAVSAARSIQTGEPVHELLERARFEAEMVGEPKPLGVCTWNALSGAASFTDSYTASSVLAWLDRLLEGSKDGGEPQAPAAGAVKSVLLDDGWQDSATYVDLDGPADADHATRKALKSFQCRKDWYDLDEAEGVAEAEEQPGSEIDLAAAQWAKKPSIDSGYEGSPTVGMAWRQLDDEAREGTCVELRDAVGRIKARGIEKVGVWMTLGGYWDGIHPESALADTYTLRRVTLRSPVDGSDQGRMFLPVLSDLRAYYTDYFTSLHAAGVDFVKVDDQSKIDWFVRQEVGDEEEDGAQAESVGALRQAMLHEMRTAAARVFGSERDVVIHCMAGTPRVFGGDLAVVGAPIGARSIIRNSDDYFPEQDDSHRWHIAINATNTVLSRALEFEPDFDMAQGSHPYAGMQLPLRAFSSARIHATDGETLEGWSRLVAETRIGPRMLQCRSPAACGAVLGGRLWDDALGQNDGDEKPTLTVGMPVPSARAAHLGLWNSSQHETASLLLDTKDVAEALAPVLRSGPPSSTTVAVTDSDGTFVEFVAAANLEGAGGSARCLTRPIRVFKVQQKQAQNLSIVPMYDLAAGHSSTLASPVAVGCVGLLGKTTGLTAIRSIRSSASPAAELVASSPAPAAAAAAAPPNAPAPESRTSAVRSQSAFSASRPFPAPQGRLSFLLAYFSGLFRLASGSPSSGAEHGQQPAARSPKTELSAMARELLRSPVRTFFSELRALVTFGYAAIAWAATSVARPPSSQGTRSVESSAAPTPPEPVSTGAAFEVETDFVSDRLGFVFSPAVRKEDVRFMLDGEEVAPELVKPSDGVPQILEVDVEQVWRRSAATQEARDGSGAIGRPWKVGLHWEGAA